MSSAYGPSRNRTPGKNCGEEGGISASDAGRKINEMVWGVGKRSRVGGEMGYRDVVVRGFGISADLKREGLGHY
jgi:hypothetical protein